MKLLEGGLSSKEGFTLAQHVAEWGGDIDSISAALFMGRGKKDGTKEGIGFAVSEDVHVLLQRFKHLRHALDRCQNPESVWE